jgi:hypothetical protein
MTAYNIGEGGIKNVQAVFCAHDIYAANMMDIDLDAMGVPDPEGRGASECNPWSVEQRKGKGFRISNWRRRKAKSQKLVQKEGAYDGTRTHVGMSKRLDLVIKGQEGTSHQAALMTGGTYVINTGNMIWAICPFQAPRERVHSPRSYACDRGHTEAIRQEGIRS